ncbi:hypothetical protein, partial [Pseudomonas sp. PNPG3]|uniref:hypothetical protein n=1 Tax=Pseudomonas sp. PNPG3 TaxID=2919497 RepID=UPI001FFCABA3
VLALTGAIAPLLCSALGHEAVTSAGPTFAVSGRPGLSLLVTVGIGLAYQVAVLLITAIGVGGSAILHRPAHGHAVISVLVYLGAGLL